MNDDQPTPQGGPPAHEQAATVSTGVSTPPEPPESYPKEAEPTVLTGSENGSQTANSEPEMASETSKFEAPEASAPQASTSQIVHSPPFEAPNEESVRDTGEANSSSNGAVANAGPEPVEPESPEQPSAPQTPSADTVHDERAQAPTNRSEDEMLFERAMAGLDQQDDSGRDLGFKKLQRGDRVEATVIQVEKDRVFVDLGTKSEGIVPLHELSEENLETAEGVVSVGDKIAVIVLRTDSPEGPIVSKKRADFEEVWQRIVDSSNDQRTITAPVVDRVKGGLVVDIGVRGFVPATHVGNGKLRNIEKYVGQILNFKIIEIDRDRRKVVLSNRLADEENRGKLKEEIFERVAPGDILEGAVRRLTDYGAFVDLGGIDGLLHISEMSWMRITHPKEVLKEGQTIKVMVLRLDPSNSKISLGLRQVLPDPWNLIKQNYRIGQKLPTKITRLVQSGAFVRLPEGAEAFLPVSEISNRRIAKPSDVLEEGQDVEATIIDLRPDERRMVLSLRSSDLPMREGVEPASGGGYEEDDRPRRTGPSSSKKTGRKGRGSGGRREEHEEDIGPIMGRVPTGGATIGERLGLLKGFLTRDDDEDEPASKGEESKADDDSSPENE